MPTKICYIDTETTGLFAYKNGIIQIAGAIEIDGVIKKTFNLRCAPFPTDEIEPRALEVNGTSLEEVRLYPDPKKVFEELTNILGSFCDKFSKTDKYFLVGYNIKFDEDFLRKWWTKCGDKYFGSWFWTPSIDVMTLAAHHLRDQRAELPNFKLGTVAAGLGLTSSEGAGLHDASTDIDYTIQIYKLCEAHTKRD